MSKKKISFGYKVLFSVISILVLVAIFTIGSGLSILNKMQKIEINKEDLGITEVPVDEKEIINIALFGIDSPDAETSGRSDAIMIATIDQKHNKLKLTSIMRDSYVNIPGRGLDKINHAYAFGGAQLALKTINENFGLNIQDFVAVDFSSLPKVIDAIGGVEINLDSEELSLTNEYAQSIDSLTGTKTPVIESTGTQTLTGTQALAYSRIRYTSGGDYKRTERQREVMEALFNKALNISPTKYPGLISEIAPYISTSLSTTDMVSLGTDLLSVGSKTLEQERFPRDAYCEGKIISEIYYLTFDTEATKQQIQNYIFEDKK